MITEDSDTTGFTQLERQCLEGQFVVRKCSPLRLGELTFAYGQPNAKLWSFEVESVSEFVDERKELIDQQRLMKEWYVLTGRDQVVGHNILYAIRKAARQKEKAKTWWGAWQVWHERRHELAEFDAEHCFHKGRHRLIEIALNEASVDRDSAFRDLAYERQKTEPWRAEAIA